MTATGGTIAATWLWRLLPAGVTLALFAPLLGAFPNELDSFDAFLVGHLAGHGQGSAWVQGGSFWLHENLCRLVSPLSWITRSWLFGGWMPGWYAVAIALQAGSAMLVGRLAERLGSSPARAALIAVLFVASPIHARTVAGLGRDFDLFATLFTLGAVLALDHGRLRGAAICAALAAMSKESGAMAVPVLAGWALLRSAPGEHRAALKPVVPAALAVAGVVALRAVQVGLAGSLEHAALPGKVFAWDLNALVVAGPAFLLACVGAALQPLLELNAAEAAWTGGASLAALALAGSTRTTLALLGLAYLALVPALLVRDPTAATDFAWLTDNARYGHLPLALLVLIAGAPGRLPGGAERLWRAGLGALATASAAALALTLVPLSVDRPVARALVEALPAFVGDDPRPVAIAAAAEAPDAARVALSQWMAARSGARVYYVARGAELGLRRAFDSRWLDFGDGYLAEGPVPAGVRWARLTRSGALVADAPPAVQPGLRRVPVAMTLRPAHAARAEAEATGVRITVDDAPPERRRAEVVGQLSLPPNTVGLLVDYRAHSAEPVKPGNGWLVFRGHTDADAWAVALEWSGQPTSARMLGVSSAAGPLEVVAPSVPSTLTLLKVEALVAP